MRSSNRVLLVVLAALAASACNCGKTTPKVVQHPKKLGEACGAGTDCESGLCATLPGDAAKSCAPPCNPSCPVGERCVAAGNEGGKAVYACATDPGKLCKACTSDADCGYAGDACLASGEVQSCGQDCSGDGSCPQGYSCVSATRAGGVSAGRQCVPNSGTCDCTEASRGQTRPCEHTNAYGTCQGLETCDPAQGYTGCNARVPAAESCNGIDDDCNGFIDDGLGQSTCGHGACTVTVENCVDGHANTCQPDLTRAVPESCNNQDDDCDGVADNGFDLNSDVDNCGTCGRACPRQNGTPSCTSGFCALSCSPGFDDCNHQLSDGCESDLSSDASNCSVCGNACLYAGGVGACAQGQCTLTGCQQGFYDLDQNPANGCEYACTFVGATDVPDLSFVDANCDGIDGEVANGVFVAPWGNDQNDGSMQFPFQTVQKGIDTAFAASKRDVYIASGTYTGTINLKDGVGLYGGYSAAASGSFWTRSTGAAVTLTGANPVIQGTSVNSVTLQLLTIVGSTPSAPSGTAMAVRLVDSAGITFDHVEVTAANGTNGLDGANGVAGASGLAGLDGDPGFEDSSGFCSSPGRPAPAGGAKGQNPSCPAANGGQGGGAGYSGNSGANGNPSVGGANAGSGRQCCKGDSFAPAANDGQDGWSFAPIDGAGGAQLGTFTANTYLAAAGSEGTDGADGVGGGGGGGGGGGTSNCDSWGSAGGGGGAGGCGGTKGTKGGGGGASIAIFLNNTDFHAIACSITAGNGGNGGKGGKGGGGGPGKPGGRSPYQNAGNYPPGSNNSDQDDGSVGGVGGAGGDGARGGHAGSGGGGPSIGVLTELGATYLPDAATQITLGLPGKGGLNAATTAAQKGADGTAQDVLAL